MQSNELLKDIKRHIEEGEMSFLIGAGFSRNVNKEVYPLWKDVLSEAVWDLLGTGNRVKQEKKVLDKAVKEHGFLGVASLVVEKAGYHEAIDTYIEKKTPYLKTTEGKPDLFLNGVPLHKPVSSDCHLLLKKLNIQNIYTFNYDNALEYFMGEEARQELEAKIQGLEEELSSYNRRGKQLEQTEASLRESLGVLKAGSIGENNALTPELGLDVQSNREKLEKELEQTQDLLQKNKEKIVETRTAIDTCKLDRKSFYNLVKDSYEISLSARRKSIYKIHGNLREDAEALYGFDGDSHTQYIITQEDYDTYNEKHGAFVNMMRIDLLRNRFCILGVSGGDANFLAWINWVKDVLDKIKVRSRYGDNDQHQSYFIYSGTDDMKPEMVLMLKNHFIQPVILKDIFPATKSDEERVKLFLESIQPLSNETALQCTELWKKIESPNPFHKSTKPVPHHIAEELFRLSSANKFNKPHSVIHSTATDVLFAAKNYLYKDAALPERMVYAAALKCSLLPFDLSYDLHDKERLMLMDKESNPSLKSVYVAAVRRAAILQNLKGLEGSLMKGDEYAKVLRNLYNFRFPKTCDIQFESESRGLDFVRKYSILQLMREITTSTNGCDSDDFQSSQELVLATAWLKYLGYKNPSLFKKADEIRQQENLMSLQDYCRAYLTAMRRGEEISTYGNLTETIYLDRYVSDVTNAAVLLNSFVELGICFSGRTVLSDTEWIAIVKALKNRYTAALAFYTIARDSKEKVIKVVAQEMMYEEHSRKALPSILKNIMSSLVSENTPDYLKGKMALFATYILPAVNVKHWSHQFQQIVEEMLNIADRIKPAIDAPKFLYGFVSNALEYIENKALRLKLLKRILGKDAINDRFDNHLNTLVIAVRERLKPADFNPFFVDFLAFGKKAIESNSQVGCFIVMNLMPLVDDFQKPELLTMLEDRALRDVYLTEGYAAQIRSHEELVRPFKEKFLASEDLWRSGISDTSLSIGMGHPKISQIDKYVSFDKEQVTYIYNDLKKTLNKILAIFSNPNHEKEDKGWMSSENNFRELVMDMRLFVYNHESQLKEFEDFEETSNKLVTVYDQCYFGKNIFQLIADDKLYRAIRRLMVESELFGIDHYRVEYGLILGKLLTQEGNELGICFQHIAWAMNAYKKFFNTKEFKELFHAILSIYKPYFDVSDGEPQTWSLIGCQKEVAEKALLSINKTLIRWGCGDLFWSNYKRVFYT